VRFGINLALDFADKESIPFGMFCRSAEMSNKVSLSIKIGQQVYAALSSKKESSKAPAPTALSGLSAPTAKGRAAEPLILSFSNEAKKMLEDKAIEAEKRRKAQEKIEETRAQAKQFEEARKASKKQAAAQRIAELKDRLKILVERMRAAFLMGDKHAAVHIAKEAASLAKELAAAYKALSESGGSSGGDSTPSVNIAGGNEAKGEEAECSESAEGVADAEVTMGVELATEAEEAQDEADKAGADGATEASPEEAAAEAEKAQKEAEKQEEQNDSDNQKRDNDMKKSGKGTGH